MKNRKREFLVSSHRLKVRELTENSRFQFFIVLLQTSQIHSSCRLSNSLTSILNTNYGFRFSKEILGIEAEKSGVWRNYGFDINKEI